MTLDNRRRTDPIAAHAYTLPATIDDRARPARMPAVRPLSQRELVAWSLLSCPDDRPPRDPR